MEATFPGQNAGASLKSKRMRTYRAALVRLPRPERRGLIEVAKLKLGSIRGRASFPGQNAGASLKYGRPCPAAWPASPFPGQNAGASLK